MTGYVDLSSMAPEIATEPTETEQTNVLCAKYIHYWGLRKEKMTVKSVDHSNDHSEVEQ